MWPFRCSVVCLASLIAVCALLLGGADGAESEEPAEPDAAALVKQLGDDSFDVRRRANEQLAAMGLAAQEALTAGLRDGDAEIRRRCRWLLQDVLESDYDRRLAAFLADNEAEQDHDLPGWKSYRESVGTDKVARELFVKMQQAEPGLMISAAAGKEAAAASFQLRIRQVYGRLTNRNSQQRKTPSVETTAALLFASSVPDVNSPTDASLASYLSSLIQQANFRDAITKGNLKPAVRKLVGHWIVQPTHQNLLHVKLRYAVQYEIEEGLELGLRAVRNKKLNGHMRVYAVPAVGQLGGKEYSEALAELLDDETECGRRVINGKQIPTQIRDIALAWLVHVTGQDHDKYGFESRAKKEFEKVKKQPTTYINTYYLTFTDADKRNAALKKWKEYVEKNPLPELPTKKPEKTEQKPDEAAAKKPAKAAAAQPAFALPLNPIIGWGIGGGVVMAQAKKETVEENAEDLGPERADRIQVQKLVLVRRLLAKESFDAATQLLDDVLAVEADALFRPETGVPLYRYLKPEAEHLLRQMPDKGHDAYKLRCESAAGHLLREAVRSGTSEALAAVAGRYFYTEAGAKATYLLAHYYLHHGHPLHAAVYLQRLRDRSPEADTFEPALSASLAACWYRSGMVEEAERVLLQLRARYPAAMVSIAGRQQRIFSDGKQAVVWLESLIGASSKPVVANGWPMFRGGPDRNLASDAGNPFLQADPLTPLCDNPLLADIAEKLADEFLNSHRAALPMLHPLVVAVTGSNDATIVLRTATHIRAIGFADGVLRWESKLEDSLLSFLEDRNESPQASSEGGSKKIIDLFRDGGLLRLFKGSGGGGSSQSETDKRLKALVDDVSPGLRRRLFRDATFGRLSSDGHSIFGVEDLTFGIENEYQRLVVTPDGRRRLDPGSLKDYNRLTAYDVKTGKLRWEIGGPVGIEMVEQPNTYFLGAPLPLGGRLYVMTESQRQTLLLDLDAETGRRVSQRSLSSREQQPTKVISPFRMPWLQTRSRRVGNSPAYADGMLVCLTPENHLVAIDLATRAVQWIYQVPTPVRQLDRNMAMMIQHGLMHPPAADDIDGWVESGVTIADGCVILTPARVDKLICLNLADGRVRWQVDRRNGLYVAGVHNGKVAVVDAGSVWAVRLDNGKPAWPHETVELPGGALPSGRGLMVLPPAGRRGHSPCLYHLPLSTAEVVVIDLERGRLVARCRSPEGVVPGNLVGCRGHVLSQGIDGLRRFDLVSTRKQQLAERLRRRPDDPKLMFALGKAVLSDGQHAEAIGLFRRVLKIEPDPQCEAMLAEALLDALRADFDTFRDQAEQLAAIVKDPAGKARFLQELAAGEQRAGRIEAALENYLKLSDLAVEDTEPQYFSAVWACRRDRWIRARVQELRTAADADLCRRIDRQIAPRATDDRLQPFLAHFGSVAAAHDVRLRLAKNLAKEKPSLQAERLLRYVIRSGSEPQQREATALLAALLRDAKQTDEAARVYRHLDRELTDVVCLDGKTGRQLVEALGADDPVRSRLREPSVWPLGKVESEFVEKSINVTIRMPVAVTGDGGPLATEASVQLDSNMRGIAGQDAFGRQRWQVDLIGSDTSSKMVSLHINSIHRRLNRGWLRGHLLLLQIGNRIFAVDGFGSEAKVLWQRDISSQAAANAMAMRMFGLGRMMRGVANTLPASQRLPAVIGCDAVCFQQERKLVAVDPLSGKELWSRADVRGDSDLFGDDEMIFVTPPKSDRAVVFSTIDGHELGRRTVPPIKQRMWTTGRRVVTWSTDDKGTRLAMVDAWTEKVIWQHTFAADSQPWLVRGEEVGVLQPDGLLRVVALSDGRRLMQARVDAQESLDGIVLLRCSDRYILIVNRAGGNAAVVMSSSSGGYVQSYGNVYGLDCRTGKMLWRGKG